MLLPCVTTTTHGIDAWYQHFIDGLNTTFSKCLNIGYQKGFIFEEMLLKYIRLLNQSICSYQNDKMKSSNCMKNNYEGLCWSAKSTNYIQKQSQETALLPGRAIN